MSIKRTTQLCLTFVVLALCFLPVSAQILMPYTNAWINYQQPYVKILVKVKGIHKLPLSILPAGFPVSNLDKLQLWYRGKQVAISNITNNEIVFYAVPNTGDTDSLLYRPMSSRLNPYYSIYSDESSYFLTVSDSKSLRSEIINNPVDEKLTKLNYHIKKDITLFNTDYSLSTTSPIRPDFFNSYFENGASRTGSIILGNTLKTFPIKLTNAVNTTLKPKLKLLIHGRSNNSRNVEVYIGKTEQTLRLVKLIANSNFKGSDFEFDLLDNDLDLNNAGFLALKSTNSDVLERFSIAYYSVEYPQEFIVSSKSSELLLPNQSAAISRISISGTESNAVIYDITDTVKIISGKPDNFMIARKIGKPVKLLITSESTTILASKVSLVNFQQFSPKDINYIIITSENLLTSSNTYALYRSSVEGGKFKTAVANINDVYNQFNYGEPSPVGIRSFISYMLSDNNKSKYLFLIGKSISFVERMVRELPNEVPTVGFPGSDVLLVEGLSSGTRDVPAIPVGRFAALTDVNVLDYLQKVKEYEHNAAEELGWRKRILHLNGGKTADEIIQLKSVLEALRPTVETGLVGGKVTPFVKQQAIAEVEKVNITPEVNAGVGMITYFGHGSPTVTDLDMGYISDAAKGYNNAKKYPFMFFNGCDVGNIFSARFNTNPNASDRMALSLDWMLAPNRGAIAIVANSFAGYVTPLTNYINSMYKAMYADSSLYNLSIGSIQAKVAGRIISEGASIYDVANIHQSLLQGDPALKLISENNPDYAIDVNEGIKLYSESSDKTIGNSSNIRTAIIVSNLGKYVQDQKVSISIDYEYKNGSTENKTEIIPAIPYQDTIYVTMPNNSRSVERITVKIDPDSVLTEISQNNNISELNIDWDVAESISIYPNGTTKDIVPPILNVTIDNRIIKNYEVLDSDIIIGINVEDDRIIEPDSSLIDIFIKPCWDDLCSFKPLGYEAGKYSISRLTNHSFKIILLSTLPSGNYEILVNARDLSGNSSMLSYSIQFQIGEQANNGLTVVCSPNPSSSYIRLESSITDYNVVKSMRYIIYNLNGTVLEDFENLNLKTNVQEWYWKPKSAPSGLYIYKVTKTNNDNITELVTGKFLLVN